MTTTVGQLLVSLQLTDSAFPSGFYTMSHGLEGLHQAKLIDKGDVQSVLEDLLLYSVAPADGAALVNAHQAAQASDWEQVKQVDRYLYASKLNAEMRRASVRSGRQLAAIATEVFTDAPRFELVEKWQHLVSEKETPGCQPISTAICNVATGVGQREAVAADLFAFASSFAGAALRLRLVDHKSAQVLLHRASGAIEEAIEIACLTPIQEIGGYVPVADVASGRHELAEARLFTT